MIVMKFGGSSVASAPAIESVTRIVREHLDSQPVVVVSAMAKTTDRLTEAFQHACRGSGYSAWRQLEDLRQFHVQASTRLLRENARSFVERKILPLFDELQSILLEIEAGAPATLELKDRVL